MKNMNIERLEKLGLTNVKESFLAGGYGDEYTCDQGDIFVNHDSGYVFLNDELISK
jgi:hypothetical protein